VESEVGRGTTFTLLFPATSEPLAAGPAEVRGQGARAATETILLVEDEGHLRRLAAAVLREQGYTVLEANHGMHALEALAAYPQPIHLLVTDLVMPHMGGTALAGLLAQKQPELRVLFMSGYDHAPSPAPPVASLRSAFLQKPFRPAALLQAVQDLLDQP
jgi:DNA-binding NtrC family response regulator